MYRSSLFWGWGFFVWSEPKLLKKDNPVALRGRQHPLHAAAGSSAESPCAHKYCRGQLESPGLLHAELRAPIYGGIGRCRCVDVWRRGVGYGSWRSHPVLLVHASAILCALMKAAGMSMPARPGITKLLECGTTEAGVDADAAASDNVKMLRERGTNGGSVCEVSPGMHLSLGSSVGGHTAPKKGPQHRALSGAELGREVQQKEAGVGCDSPAPCRREHDWNREGKTFYVIPVTPPPRKWGFGHMLLITIFYVGYSCLHFFKRQATSGFVQGFFVFCPLLSKLCRSCVG